jgi:hypothetical protein
MAARKASSACLRHSLDLRALGLTRSVTAISFVMAWTRLIPSSRTSCSGSKAAASRQASASSRTAGRSADRSPVAGARVSSFVVCGLAFGVVWTQDLLQAAAALRQSPLTNTKTFWWVLANLRPASNCLVTRIEAEPTDVTKTASL